MTRREITPRQRALYDEITQHWPYGVEVEPHLEKSADALVKVGLLEKERGLYRRKDAPTPPPHWRTPGMLRAWKEQIDTLCELLGLMLPATAAPVIESHRSKAIEEMRDSAFDAKRRSFALHSLRGLVESTLRSDRWLGKPLATRLLPASPIDQSSRAKGGWCLLRPPSPSQPQPPQPPGG